MLIILYILGGNHNSSQVRRSSCASRAEDNGIPPGGGGAGFTERPCHDKIKNLKVTHTSATGFKHHPGKEGNLEILYFIFS